MEKHCDSLSNTILKEHRLKFYHNTYCLANSHEATNVENVVRTEKSRKCLCSFTLKKTARLRLV